MKKSFALLLLFFSLFTQAQDKQYKVGIIAFYNLENLFDTIDDPKTNDEEFLPSGQNRYNSYVYLDKLSKLTEVLSQIGTEKTKDGFSILGVAEVENREVLEDLIAQPGLKERNLSIVHHHSPDIRGVDVALIYNPKYFKVKSSEPLFVPLIGRNGKPYFTRDILWVSGEYDGEPLHVFVNHWPSRRGGEEASAPGRATAAGVCKKVVDSLMAIDPNTKIVIMGDLNDDPVSPSVTDVLGAKGDSTKVGKGGLYNPWVDFYKKGIGTLAYNDSWNLFDQIIISEAFLQKPQKGFFFQKAFVFNREFMVTKTGRFKGYPMRTYIGVVYNGGYSDHFPTYIMMLKETNK